VRISLTASPCSVCEPGAMPWPVSVPVPAAIALLPALIFENLSRTCGRDTTANPSTRSRGDKVVGGKQASRSSDRGRRSAKNTWRAGKTPGARGTILRGTILKCSGGMEPSVEPGFDSANHRCDRMKPRLTGNFDSEGTQ
jgi:hypothetical protein